MNDFKLAFRQLHKSPGFTLVAVLTLALGIGANTAIFSVVEGVLLRPLPCPNAERLVRIYEALDENGARSGTLNLSDRTTVRFREFGRGIFEDVAGGTGGASVVSAKAGSPAQTVPAALVTYNFFDVLGLPLSQGRNFTREEGTDKAANVAIISDDFWRNTLNSRRDVRCFVGALFSCEVAALRWRQSEDIKKIVGYKRGGDGLRRRSRVYTND